LFGFFEVPYEVEYRALPLHTNKKKKTELMKGCGLKKLEE
jgi:hypothetical protein